ncbi:MAG: hypothetical protein Q8O26_02455 [Phreatobacter sp.]|uniref:hypothetical protein n=1 Tax=Phreatobacter sp. TaxID=1966341 RepID=UPI00273575A9|nr:hypothetical protein [Phreatobacter sp.]MDP2800722.1 hypothetical protein [Phreatobacter sp.]
MNNRWCLVTKKEGVVSRALVTGKQLDKMVHEGSISHSGRSRTGTGRMTTTDLHVLHVRFVPKSTVRYTDYLSKIGGLDLPTAPAFSGNTLADSEFGDVMFVSRALHDRTNVGDVLTVVDTRFSGDGPRLISDIADFDGSSYYVGIAAGLVLALLPWLIAIRIGKPPPARNRSDAGLSGA